MQVQIGDKVVIRKKTETGEDCYLEARVLGICYRFNGQVARIDIRYNDWRDETVTPDMIERRVER